MLVSSALLASAVLAVIGVLHVVWAWWSWPLATRHDLATKVVGRPLESLPRGFAGISVLVGALLLVAAWLVAARAALVPEIIDSGLVTAGVLVLAIVLLGRAAYGFVESGLRLGGNTAAYRRLDLRYYSPLCLLLGTLVAYVALAA